MTEGGAESLSGRGLGRLVRVDLAARPAAMDFEGDDNLREILEQARGKLVSYLSIRKELGRGGVRGVMVVAERGKPRIEAPLPIGVPFEPVALDERDPRLADLAAAGDGRIVPEVSGVPVRRSSASRWFMKLGVSGVLLWNIIFNVTLNSGLNRKWWVLGFNAGVVILLLFGFWIASKVARDAWLCVPSGIVVVRRALFSTKKRLRLFSTLDSNVVVMAGSGRSWHAEVSSAQARSRAILTDLECAALMAAWRSSVASPTVEQLSALA